MRGRGTGDWFGLISGRVYTLFPFFLLGLAEKGEGVLVFSLATTFTDQKKNRYTEQRLGGCGQGNTTQEACLLLQVEMNEGARRWRTELLKSCSKSSKE